MENLEVIKKKAKSCLTDNLKLVMHEISVKDTEGLALKVWMDAGSTTREYVARIYGELNGLFGGSAGRIEYRNPEDSNLLEVQYMWADASKLVADEPEKSGGVPGCGIRDCYEF